MKTLSTEVAEHSMLHTVHPGCASLTLRFSSLAIRIFLPDSMICAIKDTSSDGVISLIAFLITLTKCLPTQLEERKAFVVCLFWLSLSGWPSQQESHKTGA